MPKKRVLSKKKTTKKKAEPKRNPWRPAIYNSPAELQEKIIEYFNGGYRKKIITNKEGEPVEVPFITISDLVLFLGFSCRQSFYDYEKRPDFSYTLKKARTFIEREYEELLQRGNCTGAIFALKNFGWVDKQVVEKETTFKMSDIDTDGLTEQEMVDVMMGRTSVEQIRALHAKK